MDIWKRRSDKGYDKVCEKNKERKMIAGGMEGIVKPIFIKGGGNNPDNYRGIK